jgi:hypothetical protein
MSLRGWLDDLRLRYYTWRRWRQYTPQQLDRSRQQIEAYVRFCEMRPHDTHYAREGMR